MGWHIEKNMKPIPDRNYDYDFWHDDYDGADGGNGLAGTAKSFDDAARQIGEIERERTNQVIFRFRYICHMWMTSGMANYQENEYMTTENDIRLWLSEADKSHTHMIVVCDTFDHEDYPVYINGTEDAKEAVNKYNGMSMQRVMEVYNLYMPIEEQLKERRAFNYQL